MRAQTAEQERQLLLPPHFPPRCGSGRRLRDGTGVALVPKQDPIIVLCNMLIGRALETGGKTVHSKI